MYDAVELLFSHFQTCRKHGATFIQKISYSITPKELRESSEAVGLARSASRWGSTLRAKPVVLYSCGVESVWLDPLVGRDPGYMYSTKWTEG